MLGGAAAVAVQADHERDAFWASICARDRQQVSALLATRPENLRLGGIDGRERADRGLLDGRRRAGLVRRRSARRDQPGGDQGEEEYGRRAMHLDGS
jgi:hypothetical protein